MPWDIETEKYEIHDKWNDKVFQATGRKGS